jgi:hypothetical protein
MENIKMLKNILESTKHATHNTGEHKNVKEHTGEHKTCNTTYWRA